MIPGNRFLLTAGLLVALMGGLTQFDPEGMAALGLDWRQLSDAFRDYYANLQRRQELDVQDELAVRRLMQKEQLTCDLIAGRVSFLQASASFMQLNEKGPKPTVFTCPYPGASLEEKTGRQVIRWVETYMHYNPKTRNEALLRQLRKELAELVVRPQGIPLPVMGE